MVRVKLRPEYLGSDLPSVMIDKRREFQKTVPEKV